MRKITISYSLPENMVATIDNIASERETTKSHVARKVIAAGLEALGRPMVEDKEMA